LSRKLLSQDSIEDISYLTLGHAKRLTGSAYGYVGYIDPETGYLNCPTLTRDIWDTCKVADKNIVFKAFTGLWGWVLKNRKTLLTNTPANDVRSSRTPPGHVPIRRFLSVPALIGETLVGQVSVANADHDYTNHELQVIERLANLYAIAIQRQQVEKELRQLNQELEQRVHERTAKLEAANKELEAFANSVSHDLRAPIRHIDSYLELLKMNIRSVLSERDKQYMGRITSSAHKMGALVDDLLSFSRIGRQGMKFAKIDLEVVIGDIIRELEPDISGRNIKWYIQDLPVINGDVSMFRIVLMNLISNAVKFTREKEQAVIKAGSESRKGETIVFVRDNGVGFDQNYVNKLFGVFQRLHGADEFEGTGVGLAMVQRIMHRHGGRVWAEGEVGKGATFYLSLPHYNQDASISS
jgi:signal transduction histidine kinase